MQVCNNGFWAIGQIATLVPQQVGPHLVEVVDILSKILNSDIFNILRVKNENLLKHFAKTVSITLGRLASVDPKKIAYSLPKVIKPWCKALCYISDSEEKVQAYQGLCEMIYQN